jgi:hypothetical protein
MYKDSPHYVRNCRGEPDPERGMSLAKLVPGAQIALFKS